MRRIGALNFALPHREMTPLATRKQALRREMLTRRAACDPSLGQALGGHVLTSHIIPPNAVIGGFLSLPGEIDSLPLLRALHARGHVLALPETPPKGQALIFRSWTPDMALTTGRYGTRYPQTPVITPDFLLIPLLGFDDQGNRLGYGGGYYDRTLALLPTAFRMGCAYEAQHCAEIPTEATDQPLDAIATELGVTRLTPARCDQDD